MIPTPQKPKTLVSIAVCVLLVACCVRGYAQESAEPSPVAMPLDPAAAEQAGWVVTAARPQHKLAVADDGLLGAEVLELAAGHSFSFLSPRAFSGPYVAEALVRLPDSAAVRPSGAATLAVGVADDGGAEASACTLTVSRARARGNREYSVSAAVGGRQPWARPVDVGGRRAARSASLRIKSRFSAADISPVMDEQLRLSLESTIQEIPTADSIWRRLRIEVTPGSVRMYHNGLLVTEGLNRVLSDGRVKLSLTGEARLAKLEVRPLSAEAYPYVTVPLDDLCNADGFADVSSLGAPGRQIEIGRVPILLPHGRGKADHVDVGASVFRYRMGVRYNPAANPASTMRPPTDLDPARLTLRVPYRAYRRAWVLAASDGEANSAPVLTVRFYKPAAGWCVDGATQVPQFTASGQADGAKSVAVQFKDGRRGRLWLIPIELDAAALASDYRDQVVLNLELTKAVKDHVAFPDPCNYGSFQAGLPSAVRVYGLTLEEAPLWAIGTGTQDGNLYVHPNKPAWIVTLRNQGAHEVRGAVGVDVTGPYGQRWRQERGLTVPADSGVQVTFYPAAPKYGLYKVQTTVSAGDWSQHRDGTMLVLPPDRRQAGPTNSPWGIWCWFGGHGTNDDPAENVRLMQSLGIKTGVGLNVSDYTQLARRGRGGAPYQFRRNWGIGPKHYRIVGRQMPKWTAKDPYDPNDYAAYADEVGRTVKELTETHPDLLYANVFAENYLSLRLTHGVPPYAFGQPWFEYTDREAERIRTHWLTAKAAYEGVKKHAPKVRFVMGHCAASFWLPFFRLDDWDNELFDDFGLDMPQFERMPERPPRATEPSLLYFVHKEMADRGIKKGLVHLESYFPSSHPLALGHRKQADSVVRTAVLSMALGTTKFAETWSLHDCSDRWGSQHYGCVGLIGRRPEYNPKPAAAAFATMTQVLDLAAYDGWLPTGSKSTFCVRFRQSRPRRLVYCAWTIRGTRPLRITAAKGTELVAVDESGNESPVALDGPDATVTLSPTPLWLVAQRGAIEQVQAGPSTFTEAPGPHRRLLEDFEKGDWTYDPKPYSRFAENHWDVVREPGKMGSQRVASEQRKSTVWRVELQEAPEGKPMVGLYAVFTPPEPIVIPGKAKALGLWGHGRSAWNRVVYELVDAKGEVWLSCGTKDAWNCDDTHSRSYFNFDGWRYMEFPLPGNSPGDDYREKDSVWWGHSAEGVLDLPVKLTKIIVQMRTHMVYVDEMLPVDSLTVEMDDLLAVYDSPADMTDEPVKLQRAAAGLLKFEVGAAGILPNPIEDLLAKGAGPAPEIEEIYPPEQRVDGRRIYVRVKPVEAAASYRVYVSAYRDGAGAKAMGRAMPDEANIIYIAGLRPEIPMYFFATYVDADKNESHPSQVRKTVLKDEFPFK